jgi:hypothetical protein
MKIRKNPLFQPITNSEYSVFGPISHGSREEVREARPSLNARSSGSPAIQFCE